MADQYHTLSYLLVSVNQIYYILLIRSRKTHYHKKINSLIKMLPSIELLKLFIVSRGQTRYKTNKETQLKDQIFGITENQRTFSKDGNETVKYVAKPNISSSSHLKES